MAMILNHLPQRLDEYHKFVTNQKYAYLESFELESGEVLEEVVVAYKTWGKLNSKRDNCLVVCHALTGSSDIADWWGPLLGNGNAFDTSRYFIICPNVLGSPYGSTSPLSINPRSGRPYGPEFPQTTVRDDVRLHKILLDTLGVSSIAAVVGGSMGGMTVLEWSLCTPEGYVKNIVPISTSVDHDAWSIAWAEAQRQCVFADPGFDGGYYLPTPETQPAAGLAAARMVGMLTYRSSPSFNRRFGRGEGAPPVKKPDTAVTNGSLINGILKSKRDRNGNGVSSTIVKDFKAHSYLRYQGEKFVKRFDANCFIHLTQKMDHHDVTSSRFSHEDLDDLSRQEVLRKLFAKAPKNALVVGIDSDVLFRPEQQAEIADALPEASLSSAKHLNMPLLLPQDDRQWIVQKYGGTSLGKLLPQITETIIPSYLPNNKVAVVCSAISGTEKAKGTTSLLLAAIDCAITANRQTELNGIIDIIQQEHFKAIKALRLQSETGHEKLFTAVERDVSKECNELKAFLSAAQTIGELSPRSKDRVLFTGEKLSCLLVVAALRSKNVPAELVSLHNIVPLPSKNGEANHALNATFFNSIASELRVRLSSLPNGAVPVITGFFGPVLPSLIQTIGRGYTDLCAALVAVALSATELQIWKEVDGIFTADPRKVPSARLLQTVTLEEASELTFFGSEVLHPGVGDVVRRGAVRVRVLNVRKPGGRGTVIWPTLENGANSGTSTPVSLSGSESEDSSSGGSAVSTRSNSPASGFMAANGYYGTGASQTRRAPTALTSKEKIVLVNVQSNRQTKSHGFLAKVFDALDRLDVMADLITSSEQSVSLALSGVDVGDGEEEGISRVVMGLEMCGKVEVQRGMTIISVIGHKMRNMVGIAGQIFSTLASGGVNIYLIGQGASEINISLVIKEEDALVALDIIHTNVLGIPRIKTHIPILQNSMMKGPWLY
ncbi:hypothetical protein EG329_014292 [Mollisiaceae sp. DMI_Dod_QoI]|nr:hypothetical protein EG329_014292 [Helotiales sp. DMI_Dod_QoI]